MNGSIPRSVRYAVAGLAAATWLSAAQGQVPAPSAEPTDVMIRRLAGLPADTANGQIEIIDVGHGALDTMLSIVGNRTDAGWAVSYACASSPHCGASADHADHLARAYTLSAAASAEVDRILDTLRQNGEPDGQAQSPNFVGGNLLVSIDDRGFRRVYRRAGTWGRTLGRLEDLLRAPSS